jgi:hypothetical protein
MILKRIDDLESLIQSRANDPLPVNLSNNVPSTSPSIPFGEESVIVEQTQWKPSFANIDEVLKWPVFGDQNFGQQFRLLSLPEEDKCQPELPMSVDLDFHAAGHLLRSFFDDVHIFNPTLREEDVREYVKLVQFNGIGWDATSCLLVGSTSSSQRLGHTLIALNNSFSYMPMALSQHHLSIMAQVYRLIPFASRRASSRPSRTFLPRKSEWACFFAETAR